MILNGIIGFTRLLHWELNAVLGPTKDLKSLMRLKTLAEVFSATH